MKIRSYRESDTVRLKSLLDASGFGYPLPTIPGKDVLSALVFEADGELQAAALLRLEVNAFLFMNTEWRTPLDRWNAVKQLHEAMRQEAEDSGIVEEANCWVPSEIEAKFAKRLRQLGWRKAQWNSYFRQVKNGA